MSDQPSSAASAQNTQSPGAILRAARERKGLGIEQVAAQLNLRPTLVDGMEKDEYDQLRIPAYRRGYLRAYARLLEIDPAPVLKAHDAHHSTGEEPMKAPPTPLKPIKRPGRLGKATFRFISIVIVIVLIALVVLWWKGHSGTDFSHSTSETDSATQQLSPASQDDAVQGSNTTPSTEAQQQPNDSDASSTDATPNAQPSSTDTGTDNSTGNGGTGNNAGPSDQANSGASQNNGLRMQVGQGVDGAQMTASEAEAMHRKAASQQQAQPASAGTTANNAPTNSQDQAADGHSQANDAAQSQDQSANSIHLTFNQSSWTRITDASGKRVLNGLQHAGTQQTVTGQPPFHLTVGNAHGVSITYQGQPVDLGNRTVVHLNLGNQ